ncbi:MAG: protein translocase subunit SecF [Anaerolineales bacterium]|nr:protein translocase subunit SecF [Anaerolineales bacterium]
MIDILGKRYLFFALSLLIIIPGIVMLTINDLPLSIDFTGGTLMEVQFEEGIFPKPAEIIAIYENANIIDAQVQTTENNTFQIRSEVLEDTTQNNILDTMSEKFGGEVIIQRVDSVGPSIGRKVTNRAALAVGVAALAVVVYISIAFRKVSNAFRYGVCAIIAMVHDVAVVFSITGIGAYFWGWQIDALFLTALLTVIGFSVQDKIVVFDRIRENSTILRQLPFETLANHSIIQTLQRSINTQLMTVEFMLLALALFGGVTLQEFAIILLVGLFSGTYSSIFIAAPFLVVWEKKEWQNWFGRGKQNQITA